MLSREADRLQSVPALVIALLVAPLPHFAYDGPEWSNASSPGGGPVQGVGGSELVLVASTWWNGAFRSYDGGRHWEPIPGFPPVSEARVQFDPSDPAVGYVYGFGGVARTTDAGQTWSHILDTYVTYRLAIGPGGAVIATHRANWDTHIYFSTSRGDTWTDLGTPMPSFSSVYGLAFGPTQDDIVAMTISTMHVTHNGGATWTTSSHNFLDLQRAPDGTLWGAGFSVKRSHDGGATWQATASPVTGWPSAVGDDGRVFVRTSSGVITSSDGGASWANLGYGDATYGATSLVVDPQDGAAVFVSDEFLGVSRVSLAGFESRSTGLPPIDVYALGASADGSVLIAGGPHGVYASRDHGESWSHTGAGKGFWYTSAVAASADGSVLYGGGRTRVFAPFIVASTDGGATWAVDNPNLGGDGAITGIAVDPNDGRRAFAAARMDLTSSKLIETTDGGRSWRVVLTLPVGITDVAWDVNVGKPLVATDAGVFHYESATPAPTAAPWGPTLLARPVAATPGRTFSGGPGTSVWSGAGAPHAPWADTGQQIIDIAPQDADTAWTAGADGTVHRCRLAVCQVASPPESARAVVVSSGAVYAGTVGGGIYRSSI